MNILYAVLAAKSNAHQLFDIYNYRSIGANFRKSSAWNWPLNLGFFYRKMMQNNAEHSASRLIDLNQMKIK